MVEGKPKRTTKTIKKTFKKKLKKWLTRFPKNGKLKLRVKGRQQEKLPNTQMTMEFVEGNQPKFNRKKWLTKDGKNVIIKEWLVATITKKQKNNKILEEKQMNKLMQKALGVGMGVVLTAGGLAITRGENGKTQLQNILTSVNVLKGDVTKLNGQKSTLLSKIGVKNNEIASLENQIAKLEEQIAQLEQEGTTNDGVIEDLRSQIETLEGQKVALENEIEELKTQIKGLNAQIEELTNANESLTSANNELQQAFNEQKSEMDALMDAINDTSEEVGSVTSQVEELPNLDNLGLEGGEVDAPSENINQWRMSTPYEYQGTTISYEGDNETTSTIVVENIGNKTIKVRYTNALGQKKTEELREGRNTIDTPPHKFHNLIIDDIVIDIIQDIQ